jgi:hypothetical protein
MHPAMAAPKCASKQPVPAVRTRRRQQHAARRGGIILAGPRPLAPRAHPAAFVRALCCPTRDRATTVGELWRDPATSDHVRRGALP